MFEQVDHIGFAVHDLAAAIELYQHAFGISQWERIALPERSMEVAVANVGGTLLELIAPTGPDAAFAKFLTERGPGIHHIAYRVADIHAALAQAQAAGLRVIDPEPRPGIHHTLVAFIHPKSTAGALTELVQHLF